ncbi:hypothetical protein [Devosia sp.]|uniref:hypothetical protein n=1 Tax=Devosia sp. TaxID=1871048 RepID=UPI0032667491
MTIKEPEEDAVNPQNILALTPSLAAMRRAAGSSGTDFDIEPYLPELEEFDLTDDQARELLGTLVWILGFFVEHAFSAETCEQIFGSILLGDSTGQEAGMVRNSISQIEATEGGDDDE